MPTGYFALVLHAHLPFVRHPEDPTVMEEQWLYEAITGTYLPLLQMFEGLIVDHVPYRCTVSLSAPLITMLTDDLLKLRYAEHLDKLIELAEREIERTKPEPHYNRLAHMYHDRFQSLRHTWRSHEGDLVRAFRRLQEAGRVEVITSTATHAFFPLMDRNWANIRAQVHVAADLYERHFGQRPRGMWLGECGYVPGVDELLREAAIRYFFVDSHGILFADQPPGVRRVRAALLPERRRRVRPRHGVVRTGVERQGRLSGRSPLPRLLSRHRLRPAARLHQAVHPPRRASRLHRHQVPRDHAQPAPRQVGVRPGHRARQGGPARVALPRQPREAGAAPGRRTWTGRRSSSARTTPSCTATGGTRGRCSSAICSASCTSTSRRSRRSRPATTWTATTPTRSRRRARRPGASRATTTTG